MNDDPAPEVFVVTEAAAIAGGLVLHALHAVVPQAVELHCNHEFRIVCCLHALQDLTDTLLRQHSPLTAAAPSLLASAQVTSAPVQQYAACCQPLAWCPSSSSCTACGRRISHTMTQQQHQLQD